MDELSATLVRLLACTLPGALTSELRLAPASDIVAAVLDGLGAPAARDDAVAAIAEVAAGRLDVAAGLQRAGAALAPLDADPQARAALRARLDTLGQSLALAQGLSAMLREEAIIRAELRLAEPGLFELLQTIALPARPNEPELVIVGAVPPSVERLVVRLGRRAPLDRIELAYVRGSPFPLLTLATASRGAEVNWSASRNAWRQEPEMDLTIQNSSGARDLGTISTALHSEPWSYAGPRLALALPPIAGHIMAVTTVAALSGQPLARVVRIARVGERKNHG